jgi:hypothetical protein
MSDINDILQYSTIICNSLRQIKPSQSNLNKRALGRIYSTALDLNSMLTMAMLLNKNPGEHLEEELI